MRTLGLGLLWVFFFSPPTLYLAETDNSRPVNDFGTWNLDLGCSSTAAWQWSGSCQCPILSIDAFQLRLGASFQWPSETFPEQIQWQTLNQSLLECPGTSSRPEHPDKTDWDDSAPCSFESIQYSRTWMTCLLSHLILTEAEPSNLPSEFSCYQFVLKPLPINWCYFF